MFSCFAMFLYPYPLTCFYSATWLHQTTTPDNGSGECLNGKWISVSRLHTETNTPELHVVSQSQLRNYTCSIVYIPDNVPSLPARVTPCLFYIITSVSTTNHPQVGTNTETNCPRLFAVSHSRCRGIRLLPRAAKQTTGAAVCRSPNWTWKNTTT